MATPSGYALFLDRKTRPNTEDSPRKLTWASSRVQQGHEEGVERVGKVPQGNAIPPRCFCTLLTRFSHPRAPKSCHAKRLAGSDKPPSTTSALSPTKPLDQTPSSASRTASSATLSMRPTATTHGMVRGSVKCHKHD